MVKPPARRRLRRGRYQGRWPNGLKKNPSRVSRNRKRKPILFIGHLMWSKGARRTTTDPLRIHREDATSTPWHGRLKEGAASLVTHFIRLKKEGYLADRSDSPLTADEEGGSSKVVDWRSEHRDWIDRVLHQSGPAAILKDMTNGCRGKFEARKSPILIFTSNRLNPGGQARPQPGQRHYHFTVDTSRFAIVFLLYKNQLKYSEFISNGTALTTWSGCSGHESRGQATA